MSNVLERFLGYAKISTNSSEDTHTTPSTEKQWVLAKKLVEDLKGIGLADAEVDKNGYVMATLPSNTDDKTLTVGFIAHMDTCYEVPDDNIQPQIVKNYNGEDIVLNKEKNIVLSASEFPELKNYIGDTIVTTNGETLLGADDKAGVAEIITAAEYLIKHPEIKHGTIRIAFTPDEEIGEGTGHFDVKKFNADLAYTVDGGALGELEYETFNAAQAIVKIHGQNVHPGSAKDKMVNSMYLGNEFISMLPPDEVPAKTEGYEGFYHLLWFKGDVENTRMKFILRDFDKQKFEFKKQNVKNIADKMNAKYGKGTVEVEVTDQYYNMKEVIEKNKHVFDIAYKAMEDVGVKPVVNPVRGGTDGANLSYMGLPTPNLFGGGLNFHSRFEYVPVSSMEKAVEVILKIIELYAEK
jgi:tripeptide aminopeptidase